MTGEERCLVCLINPSHHCAVCGRKKCRSHRTREKKAWWNTRLCFLFKTEPDHQKYYKENWG